jgi:hypothetical protein
VNFVYSFILFLLCTLLITIISLDKQQRKIDLIQNNHFNLLFVRICVQYFIAKYDETVRSCIHSFSDISIPVLQQYCTITSYKLYQFKYVNIVL